MSHYQAKCIVIGEAGVGKSSILVQFTDQRFRSTYRSTVGIDYGTRTLMIGNNSLKFQIWDTAGQDVFQSVIQSYYRNITIALVVYDVTRPATLDRSLQWFETIADYSQPNVIVVLVGNKTDLLHHRKITTLQGATVATKYGTLFYEVSATRTDDIANLFRLCAMKIIENIHSGTLVANIHNGLMLTPLANKRICCV